MMYDIGIIGGGLQDLRQRFMDSVQEKRTLVIEGGAFGGQITTSPKVENYPVSPVSAAVSFP